MSGGKWVEGSGCMATAHGTMTLLSHEAFSRSASPKISFSLRFSHREDNACVMIHMIERMRYASLNASPLSTRVFAVRKETRVWLLVWDNNWATTACSAK